MPPSVFYAAEIQPTPAPGVDSLPSARTVVIFRTEAGEPVAIFPELPGAVGDVTSATCYARVGQHSACPLAYIARTTPARPTPELQALRAELAGIGYDLLERRRVSPKMRANLRAAHRRPVVAS